MPIIDEAGSDGVRGVMLTFHHDKSTVAYDRIAALEPEKQYRWAEVRFESMNANILYGKSARRGSVACEGGEWDGRKDPLFTVALDVISEVLEENKHFGWDLRPTFRLQMGYLLLWSAIERYVSLRYHFREDVLRKVNQLADEPGFQSALKNRVEGKRHVYSASTPEDKFVLDPEKPLASLKYYYQVRSNMTHRGKAAGLDHDEHVRPSLEELLQIFKDVLKTAFNESLWPALGSTEPLT
ncbi:MAG TPA: hypothetical protein VGR47_22530 [Terracidiphilus sp.]|nr:hypothetical protein [Terracidiphilus sp.]